MDILLYFTLGILDTLAIIGLMYRFFKFPIWEHVWKIFICATVVTGSSYICRVIVGSSILDIFMQLLLYNIFLVFVIKVRYRYAFVMSSLGYWSFSRISILIVYILLGTGLIKEVDLSNAEGLSIYLIQITAELVCFAIIYLMGKMNLGFSYVMHPPHDFYVKEKWVSFDYYIMAISILDTALFVFAFLIFHHVGYWSSSPIMLIPVILLLIFAHKRDYYDTRPSRNTRI